MPSIIIRHVTRSKKNRRYVGTFVAVPDEDKKTVAIGWSKRHSIDAKKHDGNNVSIKKVKKMGTKIATDRANSGSKIELPFTLKNDMISFIVRISKYYKDKSVALPIGVSNTDLQRVIDKKEE